MPRDKYPSDGAWNERRRHTKPHVRVHHSITNHPKTSSVWASNDLLARYIRVILKASEKGAAYTDDTLTLTYSELPACMAVTRIGQARDNLVTLCVHLGWQLVDNQDTRIVQVTIRNFAKKQGITPRMARNLRVITPPTLRGETRNGSLPPSPPSISLSRSPSSSPPLPPSLRDSNSETKKLSREEWRDVWNEEVVLAEGQASERIYTRDPRRFHGKEGVRLDAMLSEYTGAELRQAAKSMLRADYWKDKLIGILTLSGVGNVDRELTRGGKAPDTPKHGFQVHARREG